MSNKKPTIRSFKEWIEVMKFVQSKIEEKLPERQYIYRHLFLEDSIKFFHHEVDWHWGEPSYYNEGVTFITYEQFDDYRLELEILKASEKKLHYNENVS